MGSLKYLIQKMMKKSFEIQLTVRVLKKVDKNSFNKKDLNHRPIQKHIGPPYTHYTMLHTTIGR